MGFISKGFYTLLVKTALPAIIYIHKSQRWLLLFFKKFILNNKNFFEDG
jgi:hypothetical protein